MSTNVRDVQKEVFDPAEALYEAFRSCEWTGSSPTYAMAAAELCVLLRRARLEAATAGVHEAMFETDATRKKYGKGTSVASWH